MTGVLVAKILKSLERYYEACAEDVAPFVRAHEDEGAREALLVKEDGDGVEMALLLPERVAKLAWRDWSTLSLDDRCQVIEGASHFLVVCERARSDRPTTHLELELQAEVDKWLVLSQGGRLDPDDDAALRDALYEETEFLHDEATEHGERYRLANSLAARFVRKLSHAYARHGRHQQMRRELVRFFRMSQEEKMRAIAA